jgi:hypothetical protein
MCSNIPASPAYGVYISQLIDEAVSVVSLTSSSGGYINGRNSANLELLIDKTSSIYLYVSFGGILFQQVVGIRMGMNFASILGDLFLY